MGHGISQDIERCRVICALRWLETYGHRREVYGDVVCSGCVSHQQGVELVAVLCEFPAAVALLSVVVVESLFGTVFRQPIAVRDTEFESVALVVVRIGRADVDVHTLDLEYAVAGLGQRDEAAEIPPGLRGRSEEEQRFGIGGCRAARKSDLQGIQIDTHGVVTFAETLVARDEADVSISVAFFLEGPVLAGRLVADILRPVVEVEFEAALRFEIDAGVFIDVLSDRQQGVRLDHLPAVLHVVAQNVEG